MPAINSVLVTGGLGFVGSRIVTALCEKYPACHITIVDKITQSPTGLDWNGSDYICADVTSLEQITSAIQQARPEAVVHAAGLIPPLTERYFRRLEEEVLRVNVEGTRNTLAAAEAAHCRAYVYTSSCCSVTDYMSDSYANIDERWPTAPKSFIYGESKAQAEALVMAANSGSGGGTGGGSDGIATCVLRLCVVFGEQDRQLLPPIHACIAKGESPFVIGDGTNLWDTVYVGNVADAHVLALENLLSVQSAAGEVFFIQNNEPVSFREFSLEIWKNFGHVPRFEVGIPKSLAWMMGWLSEWLTWITGTPTTLSRGSVLDACAMRYASGEKAKRILGYEPRVGLEEAIRRSCQAYAKRLQQIRGDQENEK